VFVVGIRSQRTSSSFALVQHVTPHFYFDVTDRVRLPCCIPAAAGLFCSQFLLIFLFESILLTLEVHFLEDIVSIIECLFISSLNYRNQLGFFREGLKFNWNITDIWEL